MSASALVVAFLVGVAGGVQPALAVPPPNMPPPYTGKPCPETGRPQVQEADLPGRTPKAGLPPDRNRTYEYDWPAQNLRTAKQPDDEDVDEYGRDPKRWKGDEAKGIPADQEKALYARWFRYLENKRKKIEEYKANPNGKRKPSAPLSWQSWLNITVPNQKNDAQGKAYEGLTGKQFGFNGSEGWFCQETVPGGDPNRKYDFVNHRLRIAIECKSGDPLDEEQLKRDAAARNGGYTVVHILGAEKGELGPKELKAFAKKVDRLKAAGMVVFELPATGKPTPPPGDPNAGTGAAPAPTKPSGPGGAEGKPGGPSSGPAAGSLVAGGQQLADDPWVRVVADSPSSPEEAAERAEVAQEVAQELGYEDPAELGIEPQLGGVDFATLELRYIADIYDGGVGTGVRYAYQVDAKPGQEVSFGGKEAAQLAADSFFTWLVLRPETFWVNLNPEEPDRIIDARLGRTDAGRVLLEADLQMKRTVGKLIHPDTPMGQRFWDASRGAEKCSVTRQWIVPGPATVRENGNELFILDAPLQVKAETEYQKATGASHCPGQSRSDTEHNDRLYREMVLPEVVKAVNTAPEYADLRRVYASRVAAEWYRQRSRMKTTAYGKLVDSGDASAWPLRADWTPREVFDRFVKSYNDGEFKVERTTRQGYVEVTTLYIYGGVDFSTVPKKLLSGGQFTSDRPALDAAVGEAVFAPTEEDGKGKTWLGGRSAERPLSAPRPMPASPLSMPQFYLLTALPLLTWLFVGGYLLVRRRRRPPAATAAGAGPSTSVGS